MCQHVVFSKYLMTQVLLDISFSRMWLTKPLSPPSSPRTKLSPETGLVFILANSPRHMPTCPCVCPALCAEEPCKPPLAAPQAECAGGENEEPLVPALLGGPLTSASPATRGNSIFQGFGLRCASQQLGAGAGGGGEGGGRSEGARGALLNLGPAWNPGLWTCLPGALVHFPFPNPGPSWRSRPRPGSPGGGVDSPSNPAPP